MLTEILTSVITAAITGMIPTAYIAGKYSNKIKVCEARESKNEKDIETLQKDNNVLAIKLAEIQALLANIGQTQIEMFKVITKK